MFRGNKSNEPTVARRCSQIFSRDHPHEWSVRLLRCTPAPPRAPPTSLILYNIASQVVLCPEIAPCASCTTHTPCLRLRAAHQRLALLGLCAGTGGRRLWRHPADWGLRAQGMLAALRRGSCGGICGLGRALRSSWARLASSQPTLAAANALDLVGTNSGLSRAQWVISQICLARFIHDDTIYHLTKNSRSVLALSHKSAFEFIECAIQHFRFE
eukprot:COSAG05_NODE_5642_length_1123_cov_1.639648_1_plen_214_part_00